MLDMRMIANAQRKLQRGRRCDIVHRQPDDAVAARDAAVAFAAAADRRQTVVAVVVVICDVTRRHWRATAAIRSGSCRPRSTTRFDCRF